MQQEVDTYEGIKELTPTIINEFIKRIVVHAPDKSSGKRVPNEPQGKLTT